MSVRRAAVPIVVGLCCILVIGAAYSSMDGAVETDPAEVINSDTISLAYDGDPQTTREEAQSSLEEGLQSLSGQDADDETEQSRDDAASGGEESADTPEQSTEEQQGSTGTVDEDEDRDLLALLLAWLRRLLPIILTLLLLLLATATILANRDRLRDYFDRSPDEDIGPTPGRMRIEPMRPENDVERAWLQMIESNGFEIGTHPSYSSREWADAIVASGADPEPVGRLTQLFERVRYGDGDPTEDQIRQATRVATQVQTG